MSTRYVTFAATFCVALVCLAADADKDEQAIRAKVAEADRLLTGDIALMAEDVVYVTGQYPRPLVGRQELSSARDKLRQDPNRTRRNEKRTTKIQRIRVAAASDMAYEYSTAQLELDRADGTHYSGDVSVLRVWRKVKGDWQIEASFMRPNENRETR